MGLLKLHPATGWFPDALAPLYLKRSGWQAHFWNETEPVYLVPESDCKQNYQELQSNRRTPSGLLESVKQSIF